MKNQDTVTSGVFTTNQQPFSIKRLHPKNYAFGKSKPNEIALYTRYRLLGDLDARNTLVRLFEKDISRMAKNQYYKNSRNLKLVLDDLISEATIGFIVGLDKFRFDRYPGIWTICHQYVRNQLDDYVMDNLTSMRRMSSNSDSRKLYFSYNKVVRSLGFVGQMTDDQKREVAKTMKVSYKQIEFMTNLQEMKTMRDISDITNSETHYPDNVIFHEDHDTRIACRELMVKVGEIRPDLNDRELAVLDRRMLAVDSLTCAELAKELDVSISRIYQIEKTIREMLKKKLMA